MHTFTLDGMSYEYLRSEPAPGEDPRSWEYGHLPKVSADVPLAGGGSVTVYAHADRWTATRIIVSWWDDNNHSHWAWVPAASVRRVTDSEWDIEEYRRCPPNLRASGGVTGSRGSSRRKGISGAIEGQIAPP